MMTGSVTSNIEAVLRLQVNGLLGQQVKVETIIDTGFDGFLSLPASVISNLALPYAGTTRATLANGQEIPMDVFLAKVLWDNNERRVLVLSAEGNPLLGMSMLGGHRVTLDVIDGGAVMIEELHNV